MPGTDWSLRPKQRMTGVMVPPSSLPVWAGQYDWQGPPHLTPLQPG